MCVAPTLEPRRMIRTPPVRGRHYAFSPASMALGSRRPMLRKRRARCWTVVNCCDCWPMPSVEMYCWWKRSTDCPGSTVRPCDQLRDRIAQAGLQVVSLDLPLTHSLIRPATVGDDGLQEWMTRALSQLFLEFMGAFARKDSETRRARAAQGIAKVKAARVYKGRPRVSSCMRGSANAWPGGCRCGGRRGY